MPSRAHEGFGPASRFPLKPSSDSGGRLAVRPTRVRRLRIHRAVQAIDVRGRRRARWSGVVHFALRKHVTLVVDGQSPSRSSTTSSNVRELLAGEGISLDVERPGGAAAGDRARRRHDRGGESGAGRAGRSRSDRVRTATTVYQSPTDVGVWVMAGTSCDRREDSRTSSSRVRFSASSVGTSPVVSVRAVVLGKVHDVLTNAGTTGELLSAMGINADADDRVPPSPSTPLHVRLDRRLRPGAGHDRARRRTDPVRRRTPGSPRAWCRGT